MDRVPVSHDYPRLRPIDVRPSSSHPGAYDVSDPAGIAPHGLTLSAAVMIILSLMNGRRSWATIQAEYLRQRGMMLYSDDLEQIIRQLDEGFFLVGPTLDRHLAALTEEYRSRPFRPIRDIHSLGAPSHRLQDYLDRMLDHPGSEREQDFSTGSDRSLMGLIAPHLDYDRGAPCYASAYGDLARRTPATRFVILGTNHYGRPRSVIGTQKNFETPFGVVPVDGAFLARLEGRLGVGLCECEYDHVREHSIELQVILLKHVLRDRDFTIVPLLCCDLGVREGKDGGGGASPDLRDLAAALRAELANDPTPTCLLAGADLSHVGRFFNDERDLDEDALHHVECEDRRLLDFILSDDPESFRSQLLSTANPTNICSVGCLYVLAAALRGRAVPRLLGYHQALTHEIENCVTCAAVEYLAV